MASYQDIALFVLRVVVGVIFIAHGWPKITQLAKTRDSFASMMVPVPALSSLYAAFVEFFGGILLLLGLYTGWAALALAIDMLGSMTFVQFRRSFIGGWELDLLLLASCVAILLSGAGGYALIDILPL